VEKISTLAVKPSDFDTKDHFWNSPCKKCELEAVARNIIIISKKISDLWLPFSWNDYKKRCSHEVSYGEISILNDFVRRDVLDFDGENFLVNDRFIETLKQFLKKEVM
jgi:hypothetical protein